MEGNGRERKVFNLAAIDIGSNAARLLIKQVKQTPDGIHAKKLQFLRIPLRLGMDVFTDGMIGERRGKMLVRTMKIFKQLLILYNVDDYLIYATSAFRDAKNGKSMLREIRNKLKLDICVISGDEEARIIHDDYHATGNLLYMDVGGGSTELSMVCDGVLKDSRSINIGTLRMLNNKVSDAQWEDMTEQVREITSGIDNIRIVGSGGNINKLARLAKKDSKKRSELSTDVLRDIFRKLSELTVEQRMETYDLRESRADVIVPAAHIFILVAGLINAQSILVPNVGLADGMINMMAEKMFDTKKN